MGFDDRQELLRRSLVGAGVFGCRLHLVGIPAQRGQASFAAFGIFLDHLAQRPATVSLAVLDHVSAGVFAQVGGRCSAWLGWSIVAQLLQDLVR